MRTRPLSSALLWIAPLFLFAPIPSPAALLSENFDDPSTLTVGHDPAISSAALRRETAHRKEGAAALALEWKPKGNKPAFAWAEKKIPATDLRGKHFRFWVLPVAGFDENVRPGRFGIDFLDDTGKLVARHFWITTGALSMPGSWGHLGSPLEFEFLQQSTAVRRGGLMKGEGDPARVGAIRFIASVAAGSSKAAIIWDDFTELSLDEIALPGIERFLSFWREGRFGENWKLPVPLPAPKPSLQRQPDRWVITGGNLRLEFNPEDAQLKQVKNLIDGSESIPSMPLTSCTIHDNRGGSPLSLSPTRLHGNSESITWEQSETASHLTVRHSLAASTGAITLRVELQNGSATNLHLQLDSHLPFKSGGRARYYDGQQFLLLPAGIVDRIFEGGLYGAKAYSGQMPFAALYDDAKTFLVGLDPHELLSWTHSRCSTEADQSGSLQFGTRLALRPHETVSVSFVFAASAPTYRFLGSLDAYQQLFPDVFRPVSEMDPQLYTGSMQHPNYCAYRNQHVNDVTAQATELFRRFGQGWLWHLNGFKRIGDWYGTDQFWTDYAQEDSLRPHKNLSPHLAAKAEDFRKWRKETWSAEAGNYGGIQAFGIANYCERELASNQYPAEIISEITPPWNAMAQGAGAGNYGPRLYWGSGKFAHATKDSLLKLRKELPISALAHTASYGNGGFKFRGQSILEKTALAAFDKKGPYLDEGVGMAQFFDTVHQLPHDGQGHALAVAGQEMDSWLAVMRTDLLLVDDGPLAEMSMQDLFINRLRLGRKPMSLNNLHWRDTLAQRINWKDLDSHVLHDLYRKRYGFAQIAALCFGCSLSTDDVMGVPELAKVCRIPAEAMRLGYQPASGLRSDNAMSVCSRFGQGPGAILALGNLNDQRLTLHCRAEAALVSDGAAVVSGYFGQSIPCELTTSNSSFELELPRWAATPLRVAMDLHEFSGRVNATAQTEETETGLRTVAELRFAEAQSAPKCHFFVPRLHRPGTITVNDQPLQGRIVNDSLEIALPAAQTCRVVVDFESTIFRSPKSALLNFNYVNPAKTAATIIVSDQNNPVEARTAQRIGSFFRLWYAEAAPKLYSIFLAVVQGKETFSDGFCILCGPNEPTGICIKENTLQISAPTPEAREQLAIELLALLERRYPYYGEIPRGNIEFNREKGTGGLRIKAGLWDNAVMSWD